MPFSPPTRYPEPEPSQGLNHSYYHPDEPLDSSQGASSSRRRSEKSRRPPSPGYSPDNDRKSRRGSRREPSPGYADVKPSRSRRYPDPPPFAAPSPPPQRDLRSSRRDRDRDAFPPRDSPRDSQRDSRPRDADRRSRDMYPLLRQSHVSAVTGPHAVSHLQKHPGALDMPLQNPRVVLHEASRHPRSMTGAARTLVPLAGPVEGHHHRRRSSHHALAAL
ncbi:hypothetical protein TrVFT333_002035 [Trichoderma virens FT-333]|nr:hypothetical protein TrVFT333_002035 [Trichoderma virens FT-333]